MDVGYAEMAPILAEQFPEHFEDKAADLSGQEEVSLDLV